MAGALGSASPGWGYFIVFLGKTLFTLTVPLSSQVYKWIPVNIYAKGNYVMD